MADEVGASTVDATAAARQANVNIREVAAMFTMFGDDEPVEFLCECGCIERVLMTIAEYDARGGAVCIQGHQLLRL
jgi:hypothetical protein